MDKNKEIKTNSVESSDGTTISYKIIGKGPGLVIVHGAFRASQHYLPLAKYLSGVFTVYITDRRGRNESGPKGNQYSVQKECEDVIAILQKHDVKFLFGHSYGGLICLEVALRYPVAKLAVYEPAMLPYIPTDWISTFERELEQDDFISASATFLKGLRMGGTVGKLPKPMLKLLFRQMAKGEEWEENKQLLRTLPEEVHAISHLEPGTEKYKQIQAPTMIMTGSRSPRYLLTAAHDLETTVPNCQSLSFDGLDHNAPDENAPEKVAGVLKDFLKI